MASMIVIHHLTHICELREERLVSGVIDTGATMKEDERRLLAHDGAIGDEFRAFDIEKEADAVDFDSHETTNSR